MSRRITPENVKAAAEVIDLPLSDDEVGPVLARLQALLDSADQIAHLVDDTGHIDARFDARWEVEQA